MLSELNVDGNAVSAEGSYTFTNVVSNHTINEIFEWQGWNSPVLAEGLTPVNWNGSAWTTTTKDEWDYDYNSVATATHSTVEGNGDGKWANAQTADGSLYVWIPRYTYKITSGNHSSGNSWNSLDAAGTNKIEIKFTEGIEDDTTDSYLDHPAFTFGEDELTGIWVAKYEASQGSTTSQVTTPTSSSNVAKFVPGVPSWRSISVSKMYDYAYNTYRGADSHLMKNVEWGAVAYLTNAIGRIPYINDNRNYRTGIAGSSQNDSSTTISTTNAWNTANGVKASTTHNVYGIYDMSGGSWEYVAAYYTGGSSTYLSGDTSNKEYAGSLYTAANNSSTAKYVDTYSTAYTSAKTGEAVYETSSSSSGCTSWDGAYSDAPDSSNPVFIRGGCYGNASNAGVFYFAYNAGAGHSIHGFRAVLSIADAGAPATTYSVSFNANGGSGSMSNQTFTQGETKALTANSFTREGYVFIGWNTAADGTGTAYADGANYTANDNATLYAVWEPVKYTIMATAGDGGPKASNYEHVYKAV